MLQMMTLCVFLLHKFSKRFASFARESKKSIYFPLFVKKWVYLYQTKCTKTMKKIRNPYIGLEAEGYNCFACAPHNPYGLKMEFYEDGDDVVCYWTPRTEYQGWVQTLHGGIQATLMDEVGGWVISRKIQTSAMTTALNMKYRKPVPTGDDVQVEVRAHIVDRKRSFVMIEATLSCGGEVCSSADITYYCFSEQKSREEFHFLPYELEEE